MDKLYCANCDELIVSQVTYTYYDPESPLCWACFTNKDARIIVDDRDGHRHISEVEDDEFLDALYSLIDYRRGKKKKGNTGMNNNRDPFTNLPSPEFIYEYLDEYVIGQDEAKKTLSVVVSNHIAICSHNYYFNGVEDPIKKSNVLILGPSGTGKTLMASKIAEFLQVPFISTSATEYTETGYVGKDIEQVFHNLIQAAGGDITLAQRGVVFFDEVDKIATKQMSETKDVGGAGVQNALLRLMEGCVTQINPPGSNPMFKSGGSMVNFDTSEILFIFGGAFTTLREAKQAKKKKIGFESEDVKTDTSIIPDDLIKYGMIREFVGRVNHIVSTEDLTKEELSDILTEPKDSIISQHERLINYLNMRSVDLRDEKFLAEIVDDALELSTGARGLKTVLEKKLLDIYFKRS